MVASLAGMALVPVAAYAETSTTTTACTNPYTGSQAGPSEFTFTVPATVHIGDTVPVQLSFVFANNSGFAISDLNTFAMTGRTASR